MHMHDILAPQEHQETVLFDTAAALALVEKPAELFKLENLARLEDFLAVHAYELPSSVVEKLTESLAQEDMSEVSVSLEAFGAIREHVEHISTYLDSVSVAARIGSRLGAKLLRQSIEEAVREQDFQGLDSIFESWKATALPRIFGRSLLTYIMNQPSEQKLALLENSRLIQLISQDEAPLGRMAAALLMTLKKSDPEQSERLTSVPGQAQAA